MKLAIPFISHVEQKLTASQAIQIAEILGLPAEITFLTLTIDENLMLTGFARGLSQDKPFDYHSVPFNWLNYESPSPAPSAVGGIVPKPTPDDNGVVADTLPSLPADTQPIKDEITHAMGFRTTEELAIQAGKLMGKGRDESLIALKAALSGELSSLDMLGVNIAYVKRRWETLKEQAFDSNAALLDAIHSELQRGLVPNG